MAIANKLILALGSILISLLPAFQTAGATPPNVVVIMIDTLRADHLGLYGYERNTSPTIDAFGRENLTCSYAFTSAPWTPPAVASILSGLYATSHRMLPPTEHEAAKNAVAKLGQEVQTLPEIFKAHGYNTAGISPNPWISKKFGFDQGFDSFAFMHRARGSQINQAAISVVDALIDKKEPFFLYLHYLDPHSPYSPPKDFKGRFKGPINERSYSDEELRKLNLYDDEIFYLDSILAKLFEFFKSRGIYEDMVIALVADHGEQFMERGNHGHGYQLFNEEIRVPLIIKSGSTKSAGVLDAPTSVIDIAPTVLALAKIPAPSTLQGVNLLDSKKVAARSGVYSEVWRRFTQKAFIRRNGDKLISTSGAPADVKWAPDQVYQIKNDKHELTRMDNPALVTELKSNLENTYQYALKHQVDAKEESTVVDSSTLEQLRSLGYLQ